MKFKAKYTFDGPIDMVWEAREKRFQNPEQFPELEKHVEIERKEEGSKIFSKREIELSASVPKALQKILSPEMLKCIDSSEYDMEAGTHTWVITPSFKTKVFKCTGYSKYTEFEDGDNKKTLREIELDVKVNIPVLGSMAEQVILDGYKKNLMKDNDSISKMIGIMKSGK